MTATVTGIRQERVTMAVTILVTSFVEVKRGNIRCWRPVVAVARVERQRGATPGDCLRQVPLEPSERSLGLRSLPSVYLLVSGRFKP